MLVRYWSPLQDVDNVRRQFDRIFEELAPARTDATFTPAVTLVDQGDALALEVQLPGLNSEDIDIQARREAVAISGQRNPAEVAEGHKVLHNEVRYGSFRRVVSLPVEVEHEAIAANYADGVLTLTLPKVAAERNKVVKVALNSAAQPRLDATEEQAAE